LKLAKLELNGFKSFVDTTKFSFADGLTGIVGPNGCGKTNISDAIHWVLGEQNARKLRGQTMSDVIFNGSERRNAHSFSEVSITLDNDKKIIPLDAEEVVITRKVTRDGQSNYYINGQECRLKDILNLFYDTGMGRRTYSFMELKMIDELLDEKSGSKRYLIEEAAGIMKYNKSKRRCENKLGSVEKDLVRLQDIIGEVKHQVYSLRHQVGKAKRYKNLKKKINKAKIKLSGIKYFRFQKKLNPLKEEFVQMEEQMTNLTKEISATTDKYNEKEQNLLEVEKTLSKKQNNRRELEKQVNEVEKRKLVIHEKIENRKQNLEQNKLRIKELKSEKTSSSEILSNEKENLKLAKKKLKESKEKNEELQQNLQEENDKISDLYADLEKLESKINEYKNARNTLLQERSELETRKEFLQDEKTNIQEKVEDYSTKCNKFERLIEETNTDTDKDCKQHADYKDKKDKLEKQINELENEFNQLDKKFQEKRLDIKSLENEKKQLVAWQKNLSSHQEGTKKLIEKFSENHEQKISSLVQNLEVDEQYINLVENTLKTFLTAAICKQEDIEHALQILEDNSLNSRILIEDQHFADVKHNSQDFKKATSVNEIINIHNKQISQYIFNNIYLVSDRESALENTLQQADSKTESIFITPQAEIFSSYGWIETNWESEENQGVLSRNKKIKELSEKIKNQQDNLDKLQKKKENISSNLSEYKAEFASVEKKIDDMKNAADQRERKLLNLRMQLDNFSKLKEENEEKLFDIEDQIEIVESDIENLDKEIENLPHHSKAEQKKQYDIVKNRIEISRKKRNKLQNELQEINIEIAKLQKDKDFIQKTISKGKQKYEDDTQLLEKLENSLEPLQEDIQNLSQEKEQADEKLDFVMEKLKTAETDTTSDDDKYHALRNKLNKLKMELQELEFKKDVVNKNKNSTELKIQEIKLEMEHIQEDVLSRFHHDLTHDEPEDYLDLDEIVLRSQIKKHEKKLDNMGPINLAAIDDYEKKKKRFKFLQEQQKDLLESKENLKKAIKKLNDTAEKMFMETFKEINKNFKSIYQKLFEGGTGKLKLEDPSEPLNSEIEIYSNPKGKNISNIDLISRGEKALTAIAFLFANYLVKPSPFCILDEIDAPLDDANINRFLKLLNKFAEDTQFIIITHNKKTIEAVDYLYGITMEEDGVSKIVSVNLEQ